jgi:hypothetical protein
MAEPARQQLDVRILLGGKTLRVTELSHSLRKTVREPQVLGDRHAADMADTPCIFKPRILGYLWYRRYQP